VSASRLETMETCVRKAGVFIRGSVDRHHTKKSNSKDFVTVADIESQEIMRKELERRYPGDAILSEEDDKAVRLAMYDEGFTGYVIDPIDGTYSFKRGIMESAVSVGYIQDGEPVGGAVYDPLRDECYTVERGSGAFRDDTRIEVGQLSSLEGANVAMGNNYDDASMARNLQRQLQIYWQTGTMPWTSCPGSSVLSMAWTACGRIDGYHHNGLSPWDNAAAFLLVEEAGGEVQTLAGGRARYISSTVLMGNSAIVGCLREAFASLPGGLLA
jgi:myo-inositol-1(or 4)-monophosphatase